jgi:hypothetical protein
VSEALSNPDQLLANQPQVKEPERFTGHKIRLPVFEGPLDLLLYLIRAHRYDVLDIPIRQITGQFVEYLTLMRNVDADYAGDFLVTAATLMQIKARMLLPKAESQSEEIMEQDEIDPRRELVVYDWRARRAPICSRGRSKPPNPIPSSMPIYRKLCYWRKCRASICSRHCGAFSSGWKNGPSDW